MDLNKKGKPFVWGERQRAAFKNIKRELSHTPVLKLFDPRAHTKLHTDASQHGIAGMLVQHSSELEPFTLEYAVSKRTTPEESHYHLSKLELLAIV